MGQIEVSSTTKIHPHEGPILDDITSARQSETTQNQRSNQGNPGISLGPVLLAYKTSRARQSFIPQLDCELTSAPAVDIRFCRSRLFQRGDDEDPSTRGEGSIEDNITSVRQSEMTSHQGTNQSRSVLLTYKMSRFLQSLYSNQTAKHRQIRNQTPSSRRGQVQLRQPNNSSTKNQPALFRATRLSRTYNKHSLGYPSGFREPLPPPLTWKLYPGQHIVPKNMVHVNASFKNDKFKRFPLESKCSKS